METAEVQTNAPICKTQICKRPLTWMEKQKCWRCLICNPIPKGAPEIKKEKKFIDVKVTEEQVEKMIGERASVSEERIREIIRDELENWHIQKPSVTAADVATMTAPIVQPDNWRQQARELGISLMQPTGGARKKVDVLAEIEAKTK